jgi:hypothetical protein
MPSQRIVCLAVGVLAAAPALAQMQGYYRTQGPADGYLGLRVASNFGVYGRLGPGATRPAATLLSPPSEASTAGVSYGIGVSWEFAPRVSATLGWDTYDLRALGSEREPVKGPSLGLQWRY